MSTYQKCFFVLITSFMSSRPDYWVSNNMLQWDIYLTGHDVQTGDKVEKNTWINEWRNIGNDGSAQVHCMLQLSSWQPATLMAVMLMLVWWCVMRKKSESSSGDWDCRCRTWSVCQSLHREINPSVQRWKHVWQFSGAKTTEMSHPPLNSPQVSAQVAYTKRAVQVWEFERGGAFGLSP